MTNDLPQSAYLFTVFTPTFNRAHTLDGVYKSLECQTLQNFEWLIVDDGSTDGTEALVANWQQMAEFPIVYKKQSNNIGKHCATNRAVSLASGEFFLTFDSDDTCVPTALERLYWHWCEIPDKDKSRFSAVTALCINDQQEIVGEQFPYSPFDSNSLETEYVYRVKGEKWGFQRTSIMKEYPFPEHLGGHYVPEGLVWTRIARRYQTRYVNEGLRFYNRSTNQLTRQSAILAAPQRAYYYQEVLNEHTDYLRRNARAYVRNAANLLRYNHHIGTTFHSTILQTNSRLSQLVLVCSIPVALIVTFYDSWRDNR
ncbi:MAG: glycosyltransferase family 2 protein [Pseudomonadota bacterium]